jgi:uncharacterized protein
MPAGFVAILVFELYIPQSTSLKDKRHHVRHARSQLERRLGVCVAEVDFHDLRQRARLTMVAVRREHHEALRALDEAERYLSAQEFELAGTTRTVLSVEDDL